MKRLLFPVVLFLFAALCLYAKDDPGARQLLDAVVHQSQPFDAASSPFSLESVVTIAGEKPIRGHYALKFQDQDHWWNRVDFPGFSQITVRTGEKEFTSRSFPYTPLSVAYILDLFNLDADYGQMIFEKEKTRTEKGTTENCLWAHLSESKNDSHEFCVDAKTNDLLSHAREANSGSVQAVQFTDYFEFGGHRYPRNLTLLLDNRVLVSAIVTSFVSTPFDPALLVPPKDAIERRKCHGMTMPVPTNQPRTDFGPHPHRGARSRTTVSATILTDGSVTDVYVIQPGAEFANAPAVEAVKKYKFKPAMCGSEPVVADVTVDVNYISE